MDSWAYPFSPPTCLVAVLLINLGLHVRIYISTNSFGYIETKSDCLATNNSPMLVKSFLCDKASANKSENPYNE